MQNHRVRWGSLGCLALGWLTACGGVVGTGAGQASSAITGNLIVNPSFEQGIAPWGGWNAQLSRVRVRGAPDGSYVARASYRTGTAFSVDDFPGTAVNASPGSVFTATAQVRAASRSSEGKPVTLAVRELDGARQQVNVWTSTAKLGAGFQKLNVTGAKPVNGHTVDVYVLQDSAGPGDAFDVDMVTLTEVSAPAPDTVVAYDAPAGVLRNGDFTVQVRSVGTSEWKVPASYDVRVNRYQPTHATFASFDFTGSVEVRVTYNGGAVNSARVRPLSYGIAPVVNGNTVSFTLNQPRNLSVEVNGDIYRNLHLFANPPDVPADCNSPDVICFAPGLHTYQNDSRLKVVGHTADGRPQVVFTAGSNKTIYLPGGAVVQAKLEFPNASNLVVRGRGVLDLSLYDNPNGDPGGWDASGVLLSRGSNILFEGLVWHSAPGFTIEGGAVSNVTLRNIKAFSSREWGDGIDMMASSDVTVDGCFLRTSDDSIAIYGSRFGYMGDSRRWQVINSSLWADKAHPIFVGVHGDFANNGDTVDGITFRNLDILESNEASSTFWGALAIGCGDKNVVSNVLFDDIRVEHIREAGGRLVQVEFKTFNSGVFGHHISNVTFRNVNSSSDQPSLLNGMSADRGIDGVTFENLVIAGRKACNASGARLATDAYVSNVRFTGPAGGACP